MMDLIMDQEDKKISYEELKRGAQSRIGWRHRHFIGTCLRAEHARRRLLAVIRGSNNLLLSYCLVLLLSNLLF